VKAGPGERQVTRLQTDGRHDSHHMRQMTCSRENLVMLFCIQNRHAGSKRLPEQPAAGHLFAACRRRRNNTWTVLEKIRIGMFKSSLGEAQPVQFPAPGNGLGIGWISYHVDRLYFAIPF